MENIVTGHEAEMAALAAQAASLEYRAHCLEMAIESRAKEQSILDQADAGTLQPFETIFGEMESVASQVKWAKRNLALYEQKIAELQTK